MANMVVKKKLKLDFLGDEYVDDYLVFKSIPAMEIDSVVEKLDAKGKDPFKVMLEVVKDYFLEGTWLKESVDKEDLNELTRDLIEDCFATITGSVPDGEGGLALDPKDKNESTNTSPTEADTAQKSPDTPTEE